MPLGHCDWAGQVPATQYCGVQFILVLFISCVANRWCRNEARSETSFAKVVPPPNVGRGIGRPDLSHTAVS